MLQVHHCHHHHLHDHLIRGGRQTYSHVDGAIISSNFCEIWQSATVVQMAISSKYVVLEMAMAMAMAGVMATDFSIQMTNNNSINMVCEILLFGYEIKVGEPVKRG